MTIPEPPEPVAIPEPPEPDTGAPLTWPPPSISTERVPAAKPKKPFYKSWWFIVLAAVVGLGFVGTMMGEILSDSPAASTESPKSSAEASASAARASAAAASQRAKEAALAAARASALTSEAGARVASAKAKIAATNQSFTGRGAGIVKFKPLDGNAAVVTITHSGSGNIAIWSIDALGEQLDLLVNDTGKYSGTVPLNFTEDPAGLKIKASGAWTVSTTYLNAAPRWDGSAPYAGKGDAVVIVKDAVTGLTPVTITNTGRSNFVVRAWTSSHADLFVNANGTYTGTTLIPSGATAIEVNSSGSWTVAK